MKWIIINLHTKYIKFFPWSLNDMLRFCSEFSAKYENNVFL